MTPRAPKTNASRRSREEKAEKRLQELSAKYETEGMSKEAAREKALEVMRDNPRKDYRAG